MSSILVYSLCLAAVAAIVATVINNRLIALRHAVEGTRSNVAVLMGRREALIPRIIEMVREYAGHEHEILREAAQAITALSAAAAENGSGMVRLLAFAQSHPQLTASPLFQQTQNALGVCESDLVAARMAYNRSVARYNVARSVFPSSLVASVCGHTKEKYLTDGEVAQ